MNLCLILYFLRKCKYAFTLYICLLFLGSLTAPSTKYQSMRWSVVNQVRYIMGIWTKWLERHFPCPHFTLNDACKDGRHILCLFQWSNIVGNVAFKRLICRNWRYRYNSTASFKSIHRFTAKLRMGLYDDMTIENCDTSVHWDNNPVALKSMGLTGKLGMDLYDGNSDDMKIQNYDTSVSYRKLIFCAY